MINLKNILKRKDVGIWLGIAGIILLAAAFASYLTFTGFVIGGTKLVEQTIEIEVWANSYIEINPEKNQVKVELLLDNGTTLSEEIEFYLDKSLFLSEIKSEGISLFNLSEVSPGIYPLKIISQGSPAQYINPTSTEKQIEINENREIKIFEKGDLIVDETNKTILIPQGIHCKEFQEQVLWSSGYSNDPQGSTNYTTWYLENNCSSIGKSDCFIGNIELKTRFIYFEGSNKNGEGYIQISQLSQGTCSNPELEAYSNYLAYETLTGESKKQGKYCGNNKNLDSKCGIEFEDNYLFSECYGIKAYADQYFITDAFSVNYNLCGGQNE